MRALFIIIFIVSSLMFVNCVHSSAVEVDISKNLKGNISSFSYDYRLNIIKFDVEFYNTGTIGYKSRIRIDVFNGTNNIFTGWGKENVLMPGDRKNSEIYWYFNSTGNFTVRIRAYYANEIVEKAFPVEKNTSSESSNIFEIKDFRVYDDFAVLDVSAKKDAKNIIVMPSDFPAGWIFEQGKINLIKKDNKKTITIQYLPDVWSEKDMKLEITSDDGIYYTENMVKLKEEYGISRLFHSIIDKIKLALS
jgi:hypothetical protein